MMRARDSSMLACHICGLVCRTETRPGTHIRCPRCSSRVHRRKSNSMARTFALLVASVIIYIPANVLPIMYTQQLSSSTSHTIIGGVIQLWQMGSLDLALIVFTASILVPVTKLVVISYLLISVRFRSTRNLLLRTRLYRAVENIGRWSMLDLYVVTLLVSLVNFNALADIRAGTGIFAFGAVVVLTMLASMSFDPRLIWDEGTRDE